MAFNIAEMITHRARFSENKEALKHMDLSMNYYQYNEKVNAFSYYLKRLGFMKGDKCILLYKNNEDIAVCLFGAAKIGVITTVMNYRLHINEMNYIVEHSDAKMIIYADEFSFKVQQLMGVGQLKHQLSNSTKPSLKDVFSEKQHPVEMESFDDDPIVLMYTSGTTGLPKGALISHNNLFANSIGLTYTTEWSIHDRYIAVSPFFHIAGLISIVTAAHIGCTLIIMEDFEPYAFWSIVESEKVTTGMVVPTMLEALINIFEEVNPNINFLKNFTSGAYVVPPRLIEQCNSVGVTIQQTYGITEFTGAISFWVQSQHPNKHHSMGKPVIHCNLEIKDSNSGEILPKGVVGEIVVSGPQVFIGYYKNEKAYKEAVKEGQFYTGDLGYLDTEGYLYVIDRKKDLIVSGGENIYSAEIELLLKTHPKIEDVSIVAKPSEKWGEIPFAVIVLKEGYEITLEEVVEFCKKNMSSYKAVKGIKVVESLPRNAVGKILKTQLRKSIL